MRTPLRFAFLISLATTVAAGACGGNVVVDPPAAGTGGSTTSSTSSSVTGVGAGTTTSSGFMDTTASSSSGTFTSGSTSSSSTSSSSSGAPGGCTSDGVFASSVVWPATVQCAMANISNPGGLQMCIQSQTGLSFACAACLTTDVQCAAQVCLNQCISAPDGQACAQCRATSCGAAFDACAGTTQEAGSTSCAMVLGNGPTATPLRLGLDAAYFTTQNAYDAYLKYSGCACGGGCNACGGSYCMGQPANPACGNCLKQTCGATLGFCEMN